MVEDFAGGNWEKSMFFWKELGWISRTAVSLRCVRMAVQRMPHWSDWRKIFQLAISWNYAKKLSQWPPAWDNLKMIFQLMTPLSGLKIAFQRAPP